MINMSEDDLLELNGRVYPHSSGRGHVLEIYSRPLAKSLPSQREELTFKVMRVADTKFLVVKEENGLRPQPSGRHVRFYLNKSHNLPFKSYQRVKLVIKLKDFGLTCNDMGLASENEMRELLTQIPTVWVDCYLNKKPRGVNLSFSVDDSLAGGYCVTHVKDETHLLLKRVRPSRYMTNHRCGAIRKISPFRKNRMQISTSIKGISRDRILLGIFGNDWKSFDIGSCFIYQEEKELARELFQRGAILYSTHSAGPFDIGIMNDKSEFLSVIEITNGAPKRGPKRGMFSEVGSRITAKIQSLRLWSIKNSKPSFVVIPFVWHTHDWVHTLANEAKNDNCHVLLSRFEMGWEKEIAKIIMSHV